MALSSYDELLRQVATLRSENCSLRRELKDNSSHLTKLENDASNMKDVLSHMQGTFEGEASQGDVMQMPMDRYLPDADADCGQETKADDMREDDGGAFASHNSLCEDSFEEELHQGQATAGGMDQGETNNTDTSEGGRSAQDVFRMIQKLDSERTHLVQDLEKDEKQRQWFHAQLKAITHKLESLPHTETLVNGQVSKARRQLEFEAHQVQGAMAEKLGSLEQSALRQEARLERIRTIENEMHDLQTLAKEGTRDASTMTSLTQDSLTLTLDKDGNPGGYVSDCSSSTHSDHHISIATQTGEVTVLNNEHDGLIAPGIPLSGMYHGAWPIDKAPSSICANQPSPPDLASVMSFNSTNTNGSNQGKVTPTALTSSQSSASSSASSSAQPQQLGTKVEMVYSLLSMLGTHDKDDMSRTLFAMSQSQDSCIAMRQSGCLPLLLQLLHGSDKDSGLLGKTRGSKDARARAAAALHNIVHCNTDDKRGRREARTLRLLEQIRAHCDQQRGEDEEEEDCAKRMNDTSSMDHHPGAAIAALMKLSFDEDYRHAICTLGGLQAIAELLEVDSKNVRPSSDYSTTIRRYACMSLTNLTFGDGKNKALLCSMKGPMKALTDQLRSSSEDLIQAAASVLRNLSWRADLASKKTLRELGAVTVLMRAAMTVKKETTLKSILSALWNLSSHCSENKAEICAVDGALQFLVGLLSYKSANKTLAIVENGGGILRNVSSQVAIREDYRKILRKHGCLQILLNHLRSTSLTIVSNACGTLWNLSARCEEDQNALREMGAISMLRNLVHSRHKMISSGSSAALRNLLSSIPSGKGADNSDSTGLSSYRPSLHVRKQKALEADLDQNLSETCDNVDSPRNSPSDAIHRSESEPRRFVYHMNNSSGDQTSHSGPSGHRNGDKKDDDPRKHLTRRPMMPRVGSEGNRKQTKSPQRVPRAGSQDSVGSTHSDISHDRTRAHTMLVKSSHLLHKRQGGSLERKEDSSQRHHRTGHGQVVGPPSDTANTGVPHSGSHAVSSGNNYDSVVNVVPAHGWQAHGAVHPSAAMPLHHYQQQQQMKQQQQLQQSQPNSLIVQYMQEVAMLAGVESSAASSGSHVHPTSSASLLSLQHQHHHQQQKSLLERLAKSSKAISGPNNLNSSMTSSTTSSIDPGCLDPRNLPNLDDGMDQPVNYSLKYKDGVETPKIPLAHSYPTVYPMSSSNLSYKSSKDYIDSMSDNLHYPMNNSDYLRQNESVLNNSGSDGGSVMINPSLHTPQRPVPNLVYNRLHTPQSYLPNSTPAYNQQSGINWPSSPHHHPSRYVAPHHHPSYAAMSPHSYGQPGTPKNYGFSPMVYDPKSNQKLYHMPAAHQNSTNSISHFNGITSSTYAETDLDSVIDQPTDFSLRYSEVADNSCRDTYQDQPINYSLRFHGGGEVETQPTSTGGMTASSAAFPNMEELRRYEDERHCVECKYQQEVGDSSNDDQVRTFCTEGTPYLSTATSLSDLRHAGKAEDDEENVESGETDKEDSRNDCIRSGPDVASKEGELEEEEGFGFALNSSKNVTVVEAADKTLTHVEAPTPVKTDAVNTAGDLAASSSGSQATDRQTGSTVVGLGTHPVSVSRPASQQSETVSEVQTFHADDGNEGALDQTKTYAEEGTPVCFSRVSSLSSLHSSDIRGSSQTNTHGHGVASDKGDLGCISESNIPQPRMPNVNENRNTLPATNAAAATTIAPKIGSKLRKANADEGMKGDRETKTVTFDENHQVEETPLMFSRSSSPESLSSFDTQSMHSSVVSEYSRRASEVVSPSEIPDSPSESMPSSPRRTHSPTRRFKEFTSTPKTTNAHVKQSLEFIRTPSTVKADPFINFTAFDEEDKPINFASRSQEMGLISPFGAFSSQDQPISIASFGHQDDRSRPVTFTTFQKTVPASITSTQSPIFSGHSIPSAPNRFASPRARPLPTLMEQVQETESISGKSEVPVVYAEEGTPPNFSETTSLSGLTMEDAKGINDSLVLPESVSTLNTMPANSSVIMSQGPYKLPKTASADTTQTGVKTSVEIQPVPLSVISESSNIKVAVKSAAVQRDEPVVDHSEDLIEEAKEGADALESIASETCIKVEEPCVNKGGLTLINSQSLNSTCEEPNLPKLEEKETGSELVQIVKAHESVNPSYPASEENTPPQKAACSPAMDLLKQEERESSMSEVSEGEEDILAQCISSAMPTPTSSARKMRRSSSDNVIKKKSGIPTKHGDSSPSSKTAKTSSSKSSNLPKISPSVASSSASSAPKSSAHVKENQTSPASKPPRPSSKSSRSSSSHHQEDPAPGSPKSKNSPKPVHPQPTLKSSDNVNKSKQGTSTVASQHDISSGVLSNTSMSRNSLRLKHGHVSQAMTGTSNPASSPAVRLDLDKGTKTASITPVHKSKEVPCNIHPQKVKTPNGKNYIIKNLQDKAVHIQTKSGEKTGVQGTGSKEYFDDYNHDTVKSYATEGTPLNFSASTSLSDLSVITAGSNALSKTTALPDPQARQPSQEDAKSDNSSVCGENEELLLSEMIQSGMPKNNKSSRKNGGESAGTGTEVNRPPSRDCNMSAFVPRMSNLNVLPPFHDFIAVDTVKTYNVEGTPKNFSAATSLSDLTIDSVELGSAKGTGVPRKPISQSAAATNSHSSNSVKKPNVGNRPPQLKSNNVQPVGPTHPAMPPSYITQGQSSYGVSFTPPSNDSLHTYQVEGTPRSFSRQDSLNSLEVGEDSSRPQHVYGGDRDESDSSSSLPKERHVVGQSSEDSSIAGDKGSDRPIKFAIEDTPVTFSRNSSLSSLTSIDNKMDTTENINEDKTGTGWARNEKQELKASASVDSLSDEGNDCDPTPSEQLLLEQCIYAALPKSRLPRGEESARRHSRAKNFIQCNSPTARKTGNRSICKQTPSLTKSASLEIPTESGMLKGSSQAATKGSESSLKNERGSNNSLMTRSCSDTTELDFDSLTNVRQSRYTAWKRKRHHSQEEIASNDYPDIPSTGGTRFRSHSQECGNDFKMQKDISNKLAQANGRENCSSQSFRSPGFETARESQHAKPDLAGTVRQLPISSARKNLGFATYGKMEKSDAEKTMSDFAAKVREISNDSMAGLVALKDGDILNQTVLGNSSEIKKDTHSKIVKTQMAGKRDDTEENVLSGEENDYADSTLVTEGGNSEEGEGYDDVEQLMGIRDLEPGISSVNCDLVFEETDNADQEEDLDKGISPEEEERLLMENIHLVVSEIQTTKMSGSTIDEDMFIQNETISLVSNDYNSDTNSEISLTWSDKNCDMPANTMNEARSTASLAHGGSKIVKPVEGELCKFSETNEANGKAIRGRRKPLYPGKSTTQPNNKNNNKLTVPKQNNSPLGAKSTVTSVNTKAGGFVRKNISPRTGIKVAQVSPRTRQDESPSGTGEGVGRPGLKKGCGQVPKQNTPTMNNTNRSGGNSGRGRGITSRSPSVGNRNAGPTTSSTTAKVVSKSVTVSRNGNNKPTNTSPPSNSSALNNKSKQQTPAAQKSRPLKTNVITNSKLESTKSPKPQNTELPQENKENKEQITMRDRKNSSSSSSLSTANRLSSGSTGSDGGDGNPNGPSGESWTKALDSFNFIVDSTKDCMAYKHIHMQRNAKDAPECIVRTLKPPNKSDGIQDSQSAPTIVATQNISNKTAIPKAQVRRGVNQDQKNFSKSANEDTKQSTVHRSNDSLKGQNRPMTPVSGGSRRSSNSSGSGIPTRKSDSSSSPLSSDSGSKRTPPGPGGKKQVPSKIASLWKRDGSTERSPSRDSLSSPANSRLPVSMSKNPSGLAGQSPGHNKPSSLPPSGFKTKAATLPAGSSLTATKSKSVGEGISKSSTYEKISTVLGPKGSGKNGKKVEQGKAGPPFKNTKAPVKPTKQSLLKNKSPESEIRRGEVFELCDDNTGHFGLDNENYDIDSIEDVSYAANDSLENNVFNDSNEVLESTRNTLNSTSESLDSLDDSNMGQIDSNTFRKKKRDPSLSEFALPNADETCRSMCSFNESVGASLPANSLESTLMKIAGIDDSIASEISISHISNGDVSDMNASALSKASKKYKVVDERGGGKAKSNFAQGLKRLFGSNKHKDKDKEKVKEFGKSKSSKLNGKDKAKKGKDTDNEVFEKPPNLPLNTTVVKEDKSVCSQGTSTAQNHAAATQNKTPTAGLRLEHKSSPSAIVAPFNYSPPVNAAATLNPPTSNVVVIDLDSATSFTSSTTSTVITSEEVTDNAWSQSASSPSSTDSSDSPCHSQDSQSSIASDRPLTKTEMLIARRKKSSMSNQTLEKAEKRENETAIVNVNGIVNSGTAPAGCMVTTV